MSSPTSLNKSNTTDRDRALLARRAERYGRQTAAVEASERLECMLFTRGGEHYVIRLGVLREVRVSRGFCAIPGAREVVPGIIYCRGEVLSLHDLAAFMGAAAEACAEPRWIIVVESNDRRLGLMADDIIAVRSFLTTAVRPPPLTLSARASCAEGILTDGAILLRTQMLFSDPQFFNGL